MLQPQAIELPYHQIVIRLKIVSCKKFDAVSRLDEELKSESLDRLLKIIIHTVQALTGICEHILNTCTVLVLLCRNLIYFNQDVNYCVHLCFIN